MRHLDRRKNNYSYNRLPMGVKISPDVGIPNCCCYIDDLGIWTYGSFDDHLAVVDLVLSRLHANNMKCNPLKCEWFVKETDFLGFWMTPEGIKPWKKRIDAILNMDRPKNNTDVCAFIGAVNHYKSLWPRRAHVLAPLAELTGRGTFRWTPRHDKAFKEMKAIITADAMNAFPNYSIPFQVYTDREGTVSDSHNPQELSQDANGFQNHYIHRPQKSHLSNLLRPEDPSMETLCGPV